MGALLIWRAPGVVPARRRGWAAHRRRGLAVAPASPSAVASAPPPRAEPSARMRVLGRPEVSRGGLGVALVLAGGFAFLWANGALRPAGETVLAALAVLVALALIFAPSWRRLARSLAAERAERIRSQERADVGAHLHDSVLQTLALIQRSAEDPRRVTALARRQERELRGWLADGDAQGIARRTALSVSPVRWRRRPPRWRRPWGLLRGRGGRRLRAGRARGAASGRARGDAERREVRRARRRSPSTPALRGAHPGVRPRPRRGL